MVFIHSARFLQIFRGDLTTTMCRLVSASSTTYHSNMSPSVTPVIFIITATVQEKKRTNRLVTESMVETRTHQHTTLQTCPLKFALFQLARSRFPDPGSTESGTSTSWLKNYRAEVTATEAPRNCRARRSSQIKTIWGCNSTKRSRNSNTLSGRRGVRTEVEHCVSRAWDELDHTHIVR